MNTDNLKFFDIRALHKENNIVMPQLVSVQMMVVYRIISSSLQKTALVHSQWELYGSW